MKSEYFEKKRKKSLWKKILIAFLILIFIGGSTLGILLYGPYSGFRDWLITVSMTSMTHQWIAELFYSDDMINNVMNNNRVEAADEETDLNSIKVNQEVEVQENFTSR